MGKRVRRTGQREIEREGGGRGKTAGRTLLSMMNKTKIVIGLKAGRQAGGGGDAGDGDDGQGKTMSAKRQRNCTDFRATKKQLHTHIYTHTQLQIQTHRATVIVTITARHSRTARSVVCTCCICNVASLE